VVGSSNRRDSVGNLAEPSCPVLFLASEKNLVAIRLQRQSESLLCVAVGGGYVK